MASVRAKTKTGGRGATTRSIPGEVALAVGAPSMPTPTGWQWRKLTDVARLESGHTPSRRHPEYWDGDVPWIGIRDATRNHGKRIADSLQHTNDLGIQNSSARILPENTVCLSRTASVGYVIVMGRPMATSQDFVNWICSDELSHEFLKYLLLAENKSFLRFASGATHQTIYFPEVKAFHICYPPLPEQERIVTILDEAFDRIAAATAQAERNLHNARELFQSVLQSTFEQKGEDRVEEESGNDRKATGETSNSGQQVITAEDRSTKTGGRNATTRHIPGPLSLAVGMPQAGAKKGWSWVKLANLARLESGHTPSRRHPEYWGGDVPWIGIKDARLNHGSQICETLTNTNGLGIENSSARILPQATVCLSRTASVGYVLVMGRPMATSQDFVNWVCSAKLDPKFLQYIFLAEGREGLLRYASGSVHQTIYYPEAKAFHICLPGVSEQKQIVEKLDALSTSTRRLEAIYQRKLEALDELKQSLLQRAFAGEL